MAIKNSVPMQLTLFQPPLSLKNVKQSQTRVKLFICLLDHVYKVLLSNIKMERQRWPEKLFIMGKVWNPICCHGNITVKLVFLIKFSRILLQRIKHFRYKLAEIPSFIMFEQDLVECMTQSLGYVCIF